MLLRAIAAMFIFSAIVMGDAVAEECGREAFAAVVEKARAELTAINNANKQLFQDKFQLLKDREAWPTSDYVAKATPFVQDEKISAFDSQNDALLARVPQLNPASRQSVASLAGVAPSFDASPDKRCAMVEDLKAIMAELVENTRAKWTYMIGKVDAAITATRKDGGAMQ